MCRVPFEGCRAQVVLAVKVAEEHCVVVWSCGQLRLRSRGVMVCGAERAVFC